MIYVRWRKGESRRGRVFPQAGQIGYQPCPHCGVPLAADLPIQLIAVGPDDDEGCSRYEAGRWFSCTAVAMHASCADCLTDDELETLISELVLLDTKDLRDGPVTP